MNYRNIEDQQYIKNELKKRIYNFNFSFDSIYSSYDKLVAFKLFEELLEIEKRINASYQREDYIKWQNKLQEIYIIFDRYIGARVSEKPGFFNICICKKDGIFFYKDCPIHGWKDKIEEKTKDNRNKDTCCKEEKLSFNAPFNYTRESIWSHRVDDKSNSSYGGVSFP